MLTLAILCADMEASGRYLSPRAARDWWTKGLLPRPNRHSLGRGKGTETYWANPRVIQQARAAYDLLAARPRADFALLSLWLLGFPVRLGPVRAIYCKLIKRHLQMVHGNAGALPDDVVGKLSEVLARKQIKSGAPAPVRHALTDLLVEFLGIFYGVDSDLESESLTELWDMTAPYINGGESRSYSLAGLHLGDEELVSWVEYVKEIASLPAQQKTISSANDYEFIRARRLVLLVFGYLRRLPRMAGGQDDVEELGRRLLIALGRPAVPILIAVLREGTLRSNIMSSLLDFARTLRSRPEPVPHRQTARL